MNDARCETGSRHIYLMHPLSDNTEDSAFRSGLPHFNPDNFDVDRGTGPDTLVEVNLLQGLCPMTVTALTASVNTDAKKAQVTCDLTHRPASPCLHLIRRTGVANVEEIPGSDQTRICLMNTGSRRCGTGMRQSRLQSTRPKVESVNTWRSRRVGGSAKSRPVYSSTPFVKEIAV